MLQTSDQKGTKGICLRKQETHVEDSTRAIVNDIKIVCLIASDAGSQEADNVSSQLAVAMEMDWSGVD